MTAKRKRTTKPKTKARPDSLFLRFPKKRELDESEINTWIDVALEWGATFYVSYGGHHVEMHTNTESIANEGIFNAFLAYAKAHPGQFAGALLLRAREKPALTRIYPLADQERHEHRYIVRKVRS